MRGIVNTGISLVLAGSMLALSGCGPSNDPYASADMQGVDDTGQEMPKLEQPAFTFPAALAPMGDGFPSKGDPCRRLGESDATRIYLDDSALLVGCPDAAQATALGGTVIGPVGGIVLASIPKTDANAEIERPKPDSAASKEADSRFDATMQVSCSGGEVEPAGTCSAGVIRKWRDDGTTLVEVARPDGVKRALFFRSKAAVGAISSQADESSAWRFESSRQGNQTVVSFGPETYVIPDAFLQGG